MIIKGLIAVNKFETTLFWVTFAGIIALHLVIGDVVIDQKIEEGLYYFLLRGDNTNWIQTNSILYYLERIMPIYVFCVMGYLLCFHMVEKYKTK